MSFDKYIKYKIKYYSLKHSGGNPTKEEELLLLLNETIANEVENFKEMIEEYNNSGEKLLIKYQYLLSLYNLCNKFNIACNILDSQVLNPHVKSIIFPVPVVEQKKEEEFHF
jgi:hypothetical protein